MMHTSRSSRVSQRSYRYQAEITRVDLEGCQAHDRNDIVETQIVDLCLVNPMELASVQETVELLYPEWLCLRAWVPSDCDEF